MEKWTRVLYQPNLPLREGEHVTVSKEHVALSKKVATEGMVLIKNEKHLLPLAKGSRVALFGKGSFDYVKGGGGSGDVNVAYVRNLYEGLKLQGELVDIYEPLSTYYKKDVDRQYQEGVAPGMTVEPELPDDLLTGARSYADTAIVTISRFSGEGWDRSSIEYNEEYNPWETETSMPKTAGKIFEDGDFYLTGAEKTMIEKVKNVFDRIVVVLNIGGVIDTAWIKEDEKLSAALIAWQAGMEGGLAMAEILCGKVNPSGKLPDTFAGSLDDYPSTENFHESPFYVDYTEDIYVGYRYFETLKGADAKVCYPFGFGLSYTDFTIVPTAVCTDDETVKVTATVTNTGDVEGKEVVQLYYSCPQGRLMKPARELGAFVKTRSLLPGESQMVTLSFARDDMASFDDLGKISTSSYVLEKGEYAFFLGNSVRDARKLEQVYTLTDDVIVCTLSKKCAPSSLKKRLLADGSYEELPLTTPNDPNESVIVKMEGGTEEALVPAVRPRESYMVMNPYAEGAKPLIEVAKGNMTLDEFVAQLSDEDLIHLLGGQQNLSVANTFGYGNLPEYGVPNIMTADGPAGLRICLNTTAWPCATLLASTWNPQLLEEVGKAGAEEVKENNIAVWLTPAVNIHRNPLCGRNFEYYSEDPYLTGKMAAAMVRGIQSMHIGAAVKHFACNNKETNRKHSDSRLSERALREIYLKGFEIIVKEADPWVIMSAYNVINGHRASENKELLEGILREEWNFGGMVTSDWWTRGEQYKEIKAGNDVKMACGFPDRVKEAMDKGALERADLVRCAKRVLGLILKID
ncbi:MAG: glycoside hydrolase family 3 C-terminal domain-containing protein [Lachnospiraceae bacterium]|nr:glycoside hydrolase family 3 C-terminal domain-containing protein [Lachnospiraceae bacterium]